MTDLERLWNQLPAGAAPVDRILRDARRAQLTAEAAEDAGRRERRRRFLVRPLITAGAATAVVGAFVAGTLVDGGPGAAGPDGPVPGGEGPRPAAFQADLEPAADCDELLAAYVDRGLDIVSAWGWGGDPHVYYYGRDLGGEMSDTAGRMKDLDQRAAGAPETTRQTNSETGTNVQEAGVDEPDVVKTDGEVLVRLRDDELVVYDVTGEEAERTASLDLPGIEDPEIMLTGDTVVAVGADDRAPRERRSRHDGYGAERTGTRVLTVSIADPAAPEVTDEVTYDAAVTSARQHGDTIRLVLASGLPDLDFMTPAGRRGERAALEHNREAVESSTIEDWLPTITPGTPGDSGGSEQLLDCTSVAVPSDELALDTVSVVGFEAGSPADVEAIGLAGATDIAYESTGHLYLAASPAWGGFECFDCFVGRVGPAVSGGTTYLFDFALDGTSASHVASGEVEGSVADRWAMDEVDGVLRVAVGATSETGPFNAVVTFERDGEDLVELGRLGHLGRNEDIKSVRWFDGLAIVVTFREVDPLYVVDLTDVAHPSLKGELKIPGFSSYLHPLGSQRLVGVGEGPGPRGGWGAQAGLFDVSDLDDVRRIDVASFGPGTEALAGLDPRSFTWLPDERTVLTVVRRWKRSEVGYLAVMRLVHGSFETTLLPVEYGADVAAVRTVPLPDGRVLLVTGENVRFLDL